MTTAPTFHRQGSWLTNDPNTPTPPSSSAPSRSSPTAASSTDSPLDIETTVPGGTTSSLTFYRDVLTRRAEQIGSHRHAAHVYNSLQEPLHIICDGPPLVTPGKSFEQTHAEFHEMPRKKKLGRYIFCGVCGVSLKVESDDRRAVDELVRKVGLETEEIDRRLTKAKIEADNKSVCQVAKLEGQEQG
ncbi:MAG: hypothetical protein M1830_004866 [Pleopsidium flavum]|nr:MAG: hypothetical protein M1830_004866 [Pleopsidium flavum]